MSNKPLRRRCFLKALGGTMLGSAVTLPQMAQAATVRSAGLLPMDRGLKLENLHTGDRINAAFWTPDGYQPDALQLINQALRDHRSGSAIDMDVRLLETLAQLNRTLDSRETIQVLSAYRSPQTNEMLRRAGHKVAKRSYHMKGQAIDIRIPGVSLKDLHRAALSLKSGGVGYYGRSNFIHIDVGPVRRWG